MMNHTSIPLYPALNEYADDLTLQVVQAQPSRQVSDEDNLYVHRLFQVLNRRRKRCAILVNEDTARIGAIVQESAKRIAKREFPSGLATHIEAIHSLNVDELFAYAESLVDVNYRFKSVLLDIKVSKGAVVLFINDIHRVLEVLDEPTKKTVALLQAYGDFQFIGATTWDIYRKWATEWSVVVHSRSQLMVIE
jgi:ATP-dependent Clp protease ATP-binding subunit ClpB